MKFIDEIISFFQDQFNAKEHIHLHEPVFRGNERKYLLDTIDSTMVSSSGYYVNKFEEMMTSITSTKKGIALVNGTSGLQVALKLVGVKEGDEVVTQALTFVATANAIASNGASPIFIDVDLDTMGLSPNALECFLIQFVELRDTGSYNKLTGKRISACLPMHTFGFPVHMDDLKLICDAWKIPIVEDAAEALGSEYNGKPIGSFGDVGVFSLNGNKIVTSGGGGAIVTNNATLGIKAKHLVTTAKVPHSYEFYHDEFGYNYRMPNLNAALAVAQLEQLEYFLGNKRALAELYLAFFTNLGVSFRTENRQSKANYWLMCLELENRKERDLFLKETNSKNIMTRPVWQLMFRLPMYANCQRDEQKNAMFLEDRIVNIPSSVR